MSKSLFWLLITVLLITPAVQAQQTGKVPRIGFLDNSTASGSAVSFLASARQACPRGNQRRAGSVTKVVTIEK